MPGLLRLLLCWAELCCLKVGGRGRKFLGFFSGILGTQSLRRAELIRASFLGNWKGFSAAILLWLRVTPLLRHGSIGDRAQDPFGSNFKYRITFFPWLEKFSMFMDRGKEYTHSR